MYVEMQKNEKNEKNKQTVGLRSTTTMKSPTKDKKEPVVIKSSNVMRSNSSVSP
jgi:hypothetical protein